MDDVLRASRRAAARVHHEMQRGTSSLATVAATAPLFGLLATVLEICGSFTGFDGDRASIMAALTGRLSLSLFPAALGLALAIPAYWCFRYLRGQMEILDREMENVALALANQLTSSRLNRNIRRASARPDPSSWQPSGAACGIRRPDPTYRD
jgi:biopolymer transport protein ExbB/TolQ